jgi:hypothetical protein
MAKFIKRRWPSTLHCLARSSIAIVVEQRKKKDLRRGLFHFA